MYFEEFAPDGSIGQTQISLQSVQSVELKEDKLNQKVTVSETAPLASTRDRRVGRKYSRISPRSPRATDEPKYIVGIIMAFGGSKWSR